MGKGNKEKKGSLESKRMYGSVLNNLLYSKCKFLCSCAVGGFVTLSLAIH